MRSTGGIFRSACTRSLHLGVGFWFTSAIAWLLLDLR
jgi:hypothetical protein